MCSEIKVELEFIAGLTDEQRAADVQEALDDPDCDAIICSRGGYGTVRIIEQLDFTQFLEKPKWLVGFSDITILHARIQEIWINL